MIEEALLPIDSYPKIYGDGWYHIESCDDFAILGVFRMKTELDVHADEWRRF